MKFMSKVYGVDLKTAVFAFDPSVLAEGLSSGADMNSRDFGGQTAIMIAARHGLVSSVKQLIKAGADVNLFDAGGATATWLAARYGHVESLRVLADAGASLEGMSPRPKNGNTCLMMAAKYGHPECVIFLVERGAKLNVNKGGCSGETALFYAIGNNHNHIVKILLDAGADHKVMDKNGWTAGDTAAYCGNADGLELIIRAGGAVPKISYALDGLNVRHSDGAAVATFALLVHAHGISVAEARALLQDVDKSYASEALAMVEAGELERISVITDFKPTERKDMVRHV